MRTQVQPDIERPEQAELSADTRTAATPVVTLPAEEESQEALSLVPGQNRNGVLIYQVPAERVAQDGAVPPDTVAEIQGGAPLPTWMAYDGTTRTFTAIDPPPGALPLPVVVKVPTATGAVVNVPILLGEP